MPALFSRSSNTAFRLALATLAVTPFALLGALMAYVRSPWNTGQFIRVDQPVEFDHRHHVADDEIDCLYCHSGAETSDFAGIPATEVCMGCHAQVFNQSPLLEPVRRSYFSGVPIAWNRVHRLPDFVYFNHAVHVKRGIGCVHCHGRVDQMPRVEKVTSLTMEFCLDCHRDPGRVPSAIDQAPAQPYDVLQGRRASANEAGAARAITRLTTCSACHR